jgi:hypothetical protein
MSPISGQDRLNRRGLARRACLLTVRYRAGKAWHPATVIDLSSTGCRLRTGEDLSHAGAVDVWFERPIRDGTPAATLEASGSVIWTRREGLSFQIGIQFPREPEGLSEILRAMRGY